MGVRKILHWLPGGTKRTLGRVQIAGFTEQVPDPPQGQYRDAIPRRRRIVAKCFRPLNQVFVFTRSEKKAALLFVLEVVDQTLGDPRRKFEL